MLGLMDDDSTPPWLVLSSLLRLQLSVALTFCLVQGQAPSA